MEETELLRRRISELAKRCYTKGLYTYTDFLNMADISIFYEEKKNLDYVGAKLFGGYEGAEREVLRFGKYEDIGYDEPFPIDMLSISPLADKFAEDLSHRDFLGALMGLGIERSLLGDIIVTGSKAFVFCLNRITEYIEENLTSVKHTLVSVNKSNFEDINELPKSFVKEKLIQVQSERCDAVIAKVYNLSRSVAIEFFKQKKVFVNGRMTDNTSLTLHQDDVITVRGFGRFKIAGNTGISKKGKINVLIKI